MSGYVLDASVTLTWCFVDERTPETDALLERARIETILVPQLWRLEVGNILALAERRGRLGPKLADAMLASLAALRIIVDPATEAQAWGETLALARAQRLTLYDACYLELAVRKGLPLATRDAAPAAAAARQGCTVLP